ncbi:heme-binding protein 1-like [Dendropsophus ebraccatus]|uniref:heme-binding protein 1-like n=1 Tax=Dendropsophus ebraccatus TaxID=150705 RepID=UPI0038317D63
MMFPKCFFLLSLIAAYRTAEASDAIKDLKEGTLPPSFCNGLECPTYRLVKKYSGFEHRKYDASNWISTVLPMKKDEPFTGFSDIRQYMDGSNSAGFCFKDSVPLLIMVTLGETKPVNMTGSMFLAEYPENTPEPSKSTIFLKKYPEVSLYVRSFGGSASDEDYATHINALATLLTTLGLPYDKSFYGYNIYDPPDKQSDHYNEVWFLAVQKHNRKPQLSVYPVEKMKTARAQDYGFALGFTYAKYAKTLAEYLKAHDLKFDNTFFIPAAYNGPFTLFNPHN